MAGITDAIVIPEWFIRFIGAVEVLGALGLILPGVLRRHQHLTSLAALGLTIIMIGAVVVTTMGDGFKMAITPAGGGIALRIRRWRRHHG